MGDLNEEDMEIHKLNLLVQIDRAKAKVNEFRKLELEYKKKAQEAIKNIPIQEELVAELQEEYDKL